MIRLLLIISLTFSSIFAHHVEGNKKLMIAYAEEWPPYSYRDENGKMQGILVDLMDRLLHKMLHIEIEHGGFPWKQAQVMAESGIYDAVITFPSQERKTKYSVSSEHLLNLEWRGFTSVNSLNYDLIMKSENPLEITKNLNYCSVLGDGTTKKLFDKYNIKPHQSKNVDFAVQLLHDGRSDFFVNAKLTTLNLIYKNKLGQTVKLHPKVLAQTPFHFLLSNKSNINKNVVKKLDKLIKEMRANGIYQQLLDNIESNEFHHWLLRN